MRWIFCVLIVVHGLIHFMGFAKAFGLVELPQLTQPISKAAGIAWAAATLALLLTAVLWISAHRAWWAVGVGAVLLSQIVIISSWSDAKVGTVANVILLAGVVYGFASQGPLSFSAEYRREVRARAASTLSLPS